MSTAKWQNIAGYKKFFNQLTVKKVKQIQFLFLQTRVDEKSLVSVISVPVSHSSKKSVQIFLTKRKTVNREGQKIGIFKFFFVSPCR